MDELNRIRRYELKYLVTEEQAAAIREYIQPTFSLDHHANPADGGYLVNNLYLDTSDLRSYYDVKFKKLQRFKLRVRYYGDHPENLLWLEVKNKHGPTVWKERRTIAVEHWPFVLHQTPTSPGRSFESLAQLMGAQPVLHVRYFRQPWVSQVDDYGRVTLDRSLRCRMANGSASLACSDEQMHHYDDPATISAPGSYIILEIKVERQIPFWAISLIRRFELSLRGFSKYCYAIDRQREAQAPPRRTAAW